jgi:hypothetical protein
MPDVMTHYLFGLDTTNALKKIPLYPVLKEHRSVFFVGLQGPDPMYYHVLHKKETYNSIASLMHTEKTQAFLLNSILFLKSHKEEKEIFEPTLAYISGFVCHYILDAMAHPYIFYLGGRFLKDNPETIQYKGLHKHIEVAIDSLLLEQIFKLKAHKFKVHKHILKDKMLPSPILSLYKEALFSTYGILNGDTIIEKSYADFRNYFKVSYDPLGLKKNMASLTSPLFLKDTAPFAKSFSYYQCVNPFIDYLNKAKKVWLHPVTGNVYTFSFADILHNALKKSTAALTVIWDYLEDEVSFEEVEKILPNISYLTGLDLSDTREMKYFSDLSSRMPFGKDADMDSM